jgi:hypothetical protein
MPRRKKDLEKSLKNCIGAFVFSIIGVKWSTGGCQGLSAHFRRHSVNVTGWRDRFEGLLGFWCKEVFGLVAMPQSFSLSERIEYEKVSCGLLAGPAGLDGRHRLRFDVKLLDSQRFACSRRLRLRYPHQRSGGRRSDCGFADDLLFRVQPLHAGCQCV